MNILDNYTQTQFEHAFTQQLKSMSKMNIPATTGKKAFILGGQSGAGKTTLHEILKEQIAPCPVIINGDEFRKSHPHAAELQEKSGKDAVSHTSTRLGHRMSVAF